jgi:hypothetical protein
MNDKLENLLGAFRNICARDMSYLITEHGARHETGYSTFEGRPPILKECPFPQSGIFWFIVRYRWPDFVLDIGYGDRELVVEPMIYYLETDNQFAPWELVDAAAIQKAEGIDGATWVGKADFLGRTVQALAQAIRVHWSVIRCPEANIIDRALRQREQRILFAEEEERKRHREGAIIGASRAFHDGDLKKVTDLLAPFSEDSELPASARLILQLAKRDAKKR